jgi:hypothetical protein
MTHPFSTPTIPRLRCSDTSTTSSRRIFPWPTP